MEEIKCELDARRVGGDGFVNTKTLMTKMDTMQKELFKRIDARTAVATNKVFVSNRAIDENESVQVATNASSVLFQQNDNTAFKVYFQIDGTSKIVPKGYVFPRMGLCNLICNWFCSDQSKKISPLSLIPRCHFDKKLQDWYSKMKSMMHLVEEAARTEGVWKNAGYYLGNYLW